MLLDLPDEVVLEICQRLDATEVLLLRQTCLHLAALTKDRLLWANILARQRTSRRIPLPSHAIKSTCDDWSSDDLETLVVTNELVDSLWLVPRESPPVKLQDSRGELLLGVEFLADRWAVAVYADGYIHLWDLLDTDILSDDQNSVDGVLDQRDQLSTCVHTGSDKIRSYQAVVDSTSGERLLIVITRVDLLLGVWLADLYEVRLADSDLGFVLRCTFPLTSARIARQLYLDENLVAFSQLGSIELVRWTEPKDYDTYTVSWRARIDTTPANDLEEMFTMILSLRVLKHYIFVFKTRSIELHPIPRSDPPLHIPVRPGSFIHNFPSYNFRDVQISDIETSSETQTDTETAQEVQNSATSARYTLRILASDVIQGLFYFIVNIAIFHSDDEPVPPLFDVHLAAIYAMASEISVPLPSGKAVSWTRKHHNRPLINDSLLASIANQAQRDRAVFERVSVYDSPSDRASARSSSFISTYAIGSQGIRAIWIERRRGSTVKEVVCSRLTEPLETSLETSGEDQEPLPWALEGQSIYSIQSYDLREDIICCCLGEASGRIVLGNRAGDVFVLETGV